MLIQSCEKGKMHLALLLPLCQDQRDQAVGNSVHIPRSEGKAYNGLCDFSIVLLKDNTVQSINIKETLIKFM